MIGIEGQHFFLICLNLGKPASLSVAIIHIVRKIMLEKVGHPVLTTRWKEHCIENLVGGWITHLKKYVSNFIISLKSKTGWWFQPI